MMEVVLPLPESTNAMYRRMRGGYGMFKTKKAHDWVKTCLSLLKKRSRPFKGLCEVSMHFYFKRESDIDNRIKPVLDVLQEAKIYDNDKQVHSILAFKEFDKENPRVEIRVTRMD